MRRSHCLTSADVSMRVAKRQNPCALPMDRRESGNRLLPIEVKATGRPRLADPSHLRTFRAEYRKKARVALLLHTGSTLEWLAPDVMEAPWWRVL
jgi:hypothetical protein